MQAANQSPSRCMRVQRVPRNCVQRLNSHSLLAKVYLRRLIDTLQRIRGRTEEYVTASIYSKDTSHRIPAFQIQKTRNYTHKVWEYDDAQRQFSFRKVLSRSVKVEHSCISFCERIRPTTRKEGFRQDGDEPSKPLNPSSSIMATNRRSQQLTTDSYRLLSC